MSSAGEPPLPTWDDVLALLRSPKPADLTASVYAVGKPPTRVDLGAGDPGPAWAVAWVDPARLATLGTSTGTVTGSDVEGDRRRWIASVEGLRGPAAVRVWVDAATGSVVRLERFDDPAPLVVVDLDG